MGLILFVGLVVVHEFGHFIVARRNNVEVEEFGIGFPPRLYKRRMKGGYEFTINALPLGGFVRLKGEHDSARQRGSFGAARLRVKAKIILAGVALNFLVAVLLFTVLAATSLPKAQLESLPFYNRPQFTVPSDTKVLRNDVLVAVSPGSPADKAGLKDGDQIIRVGELQVTEAQKLSEITKMLAGRTVDIEYVRKGQTGHAVAELNKERTEEQGYLGVAPANDTKLRSTWSAPIVGVGLTAQYTEVTFRAMSYAVGSLFKGDTKAAEQTVGGPVAIVKFLSDSSAYGLGQIIFLIAIISLSLAIMNTLPLPALDGGRLFVTLLFRALRKPLTRETEQLIHGAGFAFLMLLFVLVTIVDIKRFF